jgi:hypothetical protein
MRLAACLLLLAAAQDSADPYFKFAKDSTWTYAMAGDEEIPKGMKMKMTVAEESEGKVWIEMTQGSQGGRKARLLWYVSDGVLYWAEKKGETLKDAIGLWKVGSKKGDTWSKPAGDTVQQHSATHMGKEDVKVPAAAYKDAVHVLLKIKEGGDDVQIDVYFVEKVGVVRMVYSQGDKKMSLDLEEFKPAK